MDPTPFTAETLPIAFGDEHLVVVHKPSGLLVHRTSLDAHETRFALQLLRRQLRQRVYPVHRLDKGASGALLFALRPQIAATLGESVRRGGLKRSYLAIVRGHTPEEGAIIRPLEQRRDPAEPSGTRDAAARERDDDEREAGTKHALTHYRRLATVELPHRVDRYPTSRYSLLELRPATGRRHQLRRHLSHASHPILGDSTYGKGRHNRLFTELFDSRRLLLACVELRFEHPVSSQPLIVTTPLAADFAAVVDRLGWTGDVPSPWLERDR